MITDGPAEGSTVPPGVASFSFDSSEPGSGFLCSLDGARVRGLHEPAQLRGPRGGRPHVLGPAPSTPPATATRRRRRARSPSPGAAPPPVAGMSVNLEPVSGTVETQVQGRPRASPSSPIPSRSPRAARIDTTKGKVQLTSEGRNGRRTSRPSFFDGVFRVKQKTGQPRGHPEARRQARLRQRQRRARRAPSADAGVAAAASGATATAASQPAATAAPAASAGPSWFVGDTCDDTTVRQGEARRGQLPRLRRRPDGQGHGGRAVLDRPPKRASPVRSRARRRIAALAIGLIATAAGARHLRHRRLRRHRARQRRRALSDPGRQHGAGARRGRDRRSDLRRARGAVAVPALAARAR